MLLTERPYPAQTAAAGLKEAFECIRPWIKAFVVIKPASHPREAGGVDLTHFVVAKLARSFGFPCKNWGAESPGDFRYVLSPRQWA